MTLAAMMLRTMLAESQASRRLERSQTGIERSSSPTRLALQAVALGPLERRVADCIAADHADQPAIRLDHRQAEEGVFVEEVLAVPVSVAVTGTVSGGTMIAVSLSDRSGSQKPAQRHYADRTAVCIDDVGMLPAVALEILVVLDKPRRTFADGVRSR